jgi:hypothetical protein
MLITDINAVAAVNTSDASIALGERSDTSAPTNMTEVADGDQPSQSVRAVMVHRRTSTGEHECE